MTEISQGDTDRVTTLPASESHWNAQLFAEYRRYVRSGEPLDTLDAIVRRVTALADYVSGPYMKGEIRDFRIKDAHTGERPFSFIVNRNDLLFYVRKTGLWRVPGGWTALKLRFQDVFQNRKGEWTMHLGDVATVNALCDFLFGSARQSSLETTPNTYNTRFDREAAGDVAEKESPQDTDVASVGHSIANHSSAASPNDYRAKLPAIRDWLIGMAYKRKTVTYSDVMSTFDLGHRNLRRAMSLLGQESHQQREPIITALIVSKITGRCSSGLEKEFSVSDDVAERVRLYVYWHKRRAGLEQMPARSTLELHAARFAQVEARPDQAAFRRAVFLAYHGKCVVSACDIPLALDAAHRTGRDWRLGHNSSDDGYLLRKDLHALYDAGLLKICGEGVVQIDPGAVQHYQQFNGIKVSTLQVTEDQK